MCINCDLPYLCLPPPLLSLAPLPPPFIPACPPPPKTPPSSLLSTPTLTLNPRVASITRTFWCVRVPWEWPPVLLPLWEASRAALARPCLLFLSFFSSPLLGWTRVCGRRLHNEDKSVLRCVLCLLWWMNTSPGCVRRHYELNRGVKTKYPLPPKGIQPQNIYNFESFPKEYMWECICCFLKSHSSLCILQTGSLSQSPYSSWWERMFAFLPTRKYIIKRYLRKAEALTQTSVWRLQSAVMDYKWLNIYRSSVGGIREPEY